MPGIYLPFRHPEFRIGVRELLPVVPGIFAWGLMTGVAMVKIGLGVGDALLMSLLVFAGSAQLAAVPLMLAAAPLWVVWATAFCVNLRFVVFSAHLRPYVMHLPLRARLFNGFLTGDLTYVLFIQRFPQPSDILSRQQGQTAYLAGSGLVNWASWVVSSVVGVVLANFIPAGWGLGFAGILALVGLLCSLTNSRLRLASATLAGATAVLAYGLPFKLNILTAIVVAVLLCLALESGRDVADKPA